MVTLTGMRTLTLTREQVIDLFGSREAARQALKYKSRQAFAMYPEIIEDGPDGRLQRIIGAAVLAGIPVKRIFEAAA